LGLFGRVGTEGVVKNVGLSGESVTGGAYVGGLVGWNDGTVSGSHAKGMVSGDSYIGGLVGWNNGTISGSYAEGNVSGNTHIGGLVGLNGGAILTSYALGAISASDESLAVGGLVGWNDGTISGSYATGSIKADWSMYVGGLVGFNNGEITNSYATGSVNGAAEVGGLVGYNNHNGTINSSYATGSVNGYLYVGGLVGVNDGTINSSYFDIQTTGQADNGVGMGLTSLQMKQSGNFTGFDSNTWVIYEDRTNPLLRTFLTPLTVTVSASGKKTYDGTTNCGTISCEVSYITTGTKTVDGTASYVLSSKNAGSVNVYASGLYSDQQGYLISYATGTAATIDKKTLTVGGTTAAGKTYDGNNTATITVGTLSGFVDRETVSATASGTFDDKNAGSRTATAAYTLANGSNGGLADNYSLANTTHSATINSASLNTGETIAGSSETLARLIPPPITYQSSGLRSTNQPLKAATPFAIPVDINTFAATAAVTGSPVTSVGSTGLVYQAAEGVFLETLIPDVTIIAPGD
jgi:hypothetical protein